MCIPILLALKFLIPSEIQPSRDGAGTIQAQSHHRHSGMVLAGIHVSSWNCPLADVPFLCVPKEKEPKERAAVHLPSFAGTRPAPLGSLRSCPRPGAAELGPRTGPQTVLALFRPRRRREGCVKWRSQKHPAAPRWLKISGNQKREWVFRRSTRRNWMASATCSARISSKPARSAIVRAILRMRL